MADMHDYRLDFITTGWLRYLPEPAFNAYGRMWVSVVDGEALAGDLDEIGAERLDVAVFGGLDATYDPRPTVTPTWNPTRNPLGRSAGRRSPRRPPSAACR